MSVQASLFAHLPLPQQQAFDSLERVRTSLPEPLQGAVQYALGVAYEPKNDQLFCKRVGKIFALVAKVPAETQGTITIRLESRNQQMGFPEDGDNSVNDPARKFTVHIPKDQINEQIRINLILDTTKSVLSSNENWIIDLKNYGLFTFKDLGSVTFS